MKILKKLEHQVHHSYKYLVGKNLRYKKFENSDEMVKAHFEKFSSLSHPNYSMFIEGIKRVTINNPLIVETGTSAWGTDSTRLFDLFAYKNQGSFHTVDIRAEPSFELKRMVSATKFHICDSVVWLKNVLPTLGLPIDLLYLDSWDVDWSSPEPAAHHGLLEFEESIKYLSRDAIVLIDDTPSSLNFIPTEGHTAAKLFESQYGVLPGKGAYVLKNILDGKYRFEIFYHQYGLALKKS